MSRERVTVLVDGSNVARCSAWRRRSGVLEGGGSDRDHELRRRLVDATCSWAAREGHLVQVAFDGAGPWRPGSVQASPEVEVIGSGAAEGDDVLERLAAAHRRARRHHWLVTSDTALRQVAGAGADRVLAADDFVDELERPGSADAEPTPPVDASPPTATRLSDTLDADVRARLERMRRGDAG